jgi:exonuclease SbcC
MREVFEVEITRPGVEKPILIDSLSNGQKFRVVFAIRVALSRLLVRRRNSTTMDFLFYDECFSSLDDKGIDDVIDVFRYLRNEFKHQIIITHRTDLKERFGKNVIIVKQDTNGISKVNV